MNKGWDSALGNCLHPMPTLGWDLRWYSYQTWRITEQAIYKSTKCSKNHSKASLYLGIGGVKDEMKDNPGEAGIHEPYPSPGVFFSGKTGPDNPREGKSARAHSRMQDAYWAAEASNSKQKWKTLVKGAVKEAKEKEVLEAMRGYKKLINRDILQDKFGLCSNTVFVWNTTYF